MTTSEKEIWNKAVAAICKEILKWDGLIPHEFDRSNMASSILQRFSYKVFGKFKK